MSGETASLWVAAPTEALCLDFANTRFWRGRDMPTETLKVVDDVLTWCAGNAAAPERQIALLKERWAARPEEGAAVLDGAVTLREAIYRLFHGIADAGGPDPDDLDILNKALAAAPARREIAKSGTGYGWRVAAQGPSALALLTPVLWSASDLLVSPRLDRVRHCANGACQWLFLDDSESGNRRWCSMSACGNRAKAHRHYLRKKSQG